MLSHLSYLALPQPMGRPSQEQRQLHNLTLQVLLPQELGGKKLLHVWFPRQDQWQHSMLGKEAAVGEVAAVYRAVMVCHQHRRQQT